MSWEPVKNFKDYIIFTEYPYIVKKTETNKIVSESINNAGYQQINLNGRCYPKHVIIAKQWLENPFNYSDIDHKNNIKLDNRLENLEWVSHKENLKRREPFKIRKHEYIEELPEENIITVVRYNNYIYNNYYFVPKSDMLLKWKDEKRYHIINPSLIGNMEVITLIDKDKKRHTISYNKFKREFQI